MWIPPMRRLAAESYVESGTGTSLNGSLDVRLKYGYLQVNMDDWLPRGTYARVGMIQTTDAMSWRSMPAPAPRPSH